MPQLGGISYFIVRVVSPKTGERTRSRMHRALPGIDVWARISLLFGALCLIKVLILLNFQRY
ncbi:MAG TPA: hypothetical protein VMA13_06735, partial [Candidatus Saccharimonadales bacterium]|nr:hypothetical protein [Candidatus Saccharimonadales bacterium]